MVINERVHIKNSLVAIAPCEWTFTTEITAVLSSQGINNKHAYMHNLSSVKRPLYSAVTSPSIVNKLQLKEVNIKHTYLSRIIRN